MRTPDSKVAAFKAASSYDAESQQFIDRMAEANIPIGYWSLPWSQFAGADAIKTATEAYVANMHANYADGKSLIFAGQYGIGKTYAACSILKAALRATPRPYTAYYTSVPEMGMYSSSWKHKDQYLAACLNSDFLVIDEVDSRHIPNSEEAAAYFGDMLERVVRARVQNKMPMLFGTNHQSLEPALTGQYAKAIGSLLAPCSTTVLAMGRDFRKKT